MVSESRPVHGFADVGMKDVVWGSDEAQQVGNQVPQESGVEEVVDVEALVKEFVSSPDFDSGITAFTYKTFQYVSCGGRRVSPGDIMREYGVDVPEGSVKDFLRLLGTYLEKENHLSTVR